MEDPDDSAISSTSDRRDEESGDEEDDEIEVEDADEIDVEEADEKEDGEDNDEDNVDNDDDDADSSLSPPPSEDARDGHISSTVEAQDEDSDSTQTGPEPKTDDDGFAQPKVPPLHHLTQLASAARFSPFSGSASGSKQSSSSTGSDSSHELSPYSSPSSSPKPNLSYEEQQKFNAMVSTLSYNPPSHAAPKADQRYTLDVLRNGAIVESKRFLVTDQKGYYIVGRIPGCDIVAANPSVSRLHAILQFVKVNGPTGGADKDKEMTNPQETGLYLYDLNSTHGTFINKNQIYPYKFYRVRVGHLLKFGTSHRMYIVSGPSEDEEQESEKSVSELQSEKLAKELERKRLEEEDQLKRNPEQIPMRDVEKDGISWGMADDAEEETDIQINPFAVDYEASELMLNDPKKSLRSWFEREGFDLDYEMLEKVKGQFVCRIGLPLNGIKAPLVYAESEVKFKKKEAALDAAMKGCQILDTHGLLRGSNQESRKRKEKKYEDDDYYSSDEDTFLDRTGTIEKKREKRMRMAGKLEQKVDTYDTLCAKHSELKAEIADLQSKLDKSSRLKNRRGGEDSSSSSGGADDEDEEMDVDDYVKMLKTGAFDTKKLRARLKEATEELEKNQKLIDFTKPVELPSYLKPAACDIVPSLPSYSAPKKEGKSPSKESKSGSKLEEWFPDKEDSTARSPFSVEEREKPSHRKSEPPVVGPMRLSFLSTKQRLYGLIKKPSALSSLKTTVGAPPPSAAASRADDDDEEDSEEDSEEEKEVEVDVEKKDESDQDVKVAEEEKEPTKIDTQPEKEKHKSSGKKKRHHRHKHHHHHHGKKQKRNEGSSYDASDPNYSTWVPPSNQKGDGRTSLNEKLGY
ncbi:unnamed protein product [Orchesella dallaii]|uniref:FHA domain-containing protein n=1 Tax=Orchesella dallaii TaxID=48710 RepID=A0ABP1S786_9HEXA